MGCIRKCGNCKNRFYEDWGGKYPCICYEMTNTEKEEIEEAKSCKQYVFDDRNKEPYCPSATNGDYSPSNPWDAPGMSIRDFV